MTIAELLREDGKVEGRAEGKAEGKAEGRAEGKAEGKAEGAKLIATNLITLGLSNEVIIQSTGLTLEEVLALRA